MTSPRRPASCGTIWRTVWETRLATSGYGYDYGYGVCADQQNVFVSGFTSGTFPGFASGGGLDGFVAALTPEGALTWVRQFGSPADDRAFAVAVAQVTNTVFGETRGGFGPLDPVISIGGGADLFLVLFDRKGAQVRSKRFGSGFSGLAFDMVARADGTLYLTGMTSGALQPSVPTPFERRCS